MPPLRFVGYLLAGATTRPLRRLFKGPLREGWPLGFEIVHHAMKRSSAYTAHLSVEAARDFQERMAQPLKLPVQRELLEIEGVSTERFVPENPREGSALIYLHGGSYLMCSSRTHAELIARLAIATRLPTWAVNYRLRPEHPIEDAIQDVLTVYRHLLGSHPRVVFAGDSAGGGLAVTSMLALREAGEPMPAAAALISPWVELRTERESYRDNEVTDWATTRDLQAQIDVVLAEASPDDPRFSPLCADSLTGLPPLLLHAGDAELLRDDVIAFAERLAAERVPHTLTLWPNMVHNFHLFASVLPLALQAIDDIAEFVTQHVDA